MENNLVKNNELYQQLKNAIKDIYVDVHAIYEPDGSEFLGDCYCAAVDLFSFDFTFRIYFKIVDEKIKVEHVERWRFG